jgi:hypothetical protein
MGEVKQCHGRRCFSGSLLRDRMEFMVDGLTLE